MTMETIPWESHKFLRTPEDVAAYLDAALEEGDPSFLSEALGTVARSEGMTRIARDSGLSREALYKSLSAGGNPELVTIVKVLRSLGLRLGVKPIDSDAA